MLECKIASTISEYNAVYHLRYKIYCTEKKWLDADCYPSMLEKDVYDATSVHFMGCIDGELVGSMRIIVGCPLPVEQHPSIHEELCTKGSAELSRNSPAGTVFMPFCYFEAAANVLTNAALDPQAKIAEVKYCAVRLSAV